MKKISEVFERYIIDDVYFGTVAKLISRVASLGLIVFVLYVIWHLYRWLAE